MATRVLDECEAKRALMDNVFTLMAKIDGEWGCCHEPDQIRRGECKDTPVDEIRALRILAVPYASHPDYRPEWRDQP